MRPHFNKETILGSYLATSAIEATHVASENRRGFEEKLFWGSVYSWNGYIRQYVNGMAHTSGRVTYSGKKQKIGLCMGHRMDLSVRVLRFSDLVVYRDCLDPFQPVE